MIFAMPDQEMPDPRFFNEWHESGVHQLDKLVPLLLDELAGKTLDRVCQIQRLCCEDGEITPENGEFEIYTKEGGSLAFFASSFGVSIQTNLYPVISIYEDPVLRQLMDDKNADMRDFYHLDVRADLTAQRPLSSAVGSAISGIDLVVSLKSSQDSCNRVPGIMLTAGDYQFGFRNPLLDELFFDWGDFTDSLVAQLKDGHPRSEFAIHQIYP